MNLRANFFLIAFFAVDVVLVAAVVNRHKETLMRWAERWYKRFSKLPGFVLISGTLYHFTLHGRFRILWTTFGIVSSVSWTMNVEFPAPFRDFLTLISWIQLSFPVRSV